MKRYPKPGPTGGRLIREVIRHLRANEIKLPITSHILLAVSGGIDSLALAHLLVHYGRRIAARSKLRMIHVDHSWSSQSKATARFVKNLAKKWKVPCQVRTLKRSAQFKRGESAEANARKLRKTLLVKLAKKSGAKIFTAHQADDLAETVLWRILTGTGETHAGGIAVQHGREIRPVLSITKDDLKRYLLEERQQWREDPSNSDRKFLRARIRILLPEIERVFPRARQHLVQLAFRAQKILNGPSAAKRTGDPFAPLSAKGLRIKRSHWDAIGQVEADLPEGWKLVRERTPRIR